MSASAIVLLLCACGGGGAPGDGSSTDDVAGGGLDAQGGGDGSPNDGPVVVSDTGVTVRDRDGGAWTCFPVSCAGHTLQCGDCADNDDDGLIDSHDPECIGPCSNSEVNLFGSVGGGTAVACNLNCYFNFGQGGGTGCTWDHHCDPLVPVAGCDYVAPAMRNPGLAMRCPDAQTSACHSSCEPLTPNGCDCFGCCQFGSSFLYIGTRDTSGRPTCTIQAARARDTAACHPCTPVTDPVTSGFSCGNSCERCEYCIDGHVPDPSCYTSTPDGGAPQDGGTNTMQCGTGIQPCGQPNQAPCPSNAYCITGCCQIVPG